MCVRCGTGRVAWCTDPYRHGESTEPVSPGDPPVVADTCPARMDEDRAVLLARMADDIMADGGHVPVGLPPGCLSFTVLVWPEHPADPREVRFSATWPGITLACSRSLAGYSLEGGLHREH